MLVAAVRDDVVQVAVVQVNVMIDDVVDIGLFIGAMSWISKLIICLTSTCSYVGCQAFYTGMRARSSPSLC